MTDNELGMILAGIETAKDEKELQAMADALEKRKKQLTEENIKKKNRIMTMRALFSDWQKMAEKKLDGLFDNFHFCDDAMFIKITAENMAECLKRINYKVECPHKDEGVNTGDFYFRLDDLKFYDMYIDNTNDVIIPLEL